MVSANARGVPRAGTDAPGQPPRRPAATAPPGQPPRRPAATALPCFASRPASRAALQRRSVREHGPGPCTCAAIPRAGSNPPRGHATCEGATPAGSLIRGNIPRSNHGSARASIRRPFRSRRRSLPLASTAARAGSGACRPALEHGKRGSSAAEARPSAAEARPSAPWRASPRCPRALRRVTRPENAAGDIRGASPARAPVIAAPVPDRDAGLSALPDGSHEVDRAGSRIPATREGSRTPATREPGRARTRTPATRERSPIPATREPGHARTRIPGRMGDASAQSCPDR